MWSILRLAETFINTDADGQTSGKTQLLMNLKGGKWEQNRISDVKVTVYGDAAVATGAWRGKGVDGDGTKIDRGERWTDTWVKTGNGKWRWWPVSRPQPNEVTAPGRESSRASPSAFGPFESKADYFCSVLG